jgi:hypothetical protein
VKEVSRAGVEAQVAELAWDVLETWDKHAAMSRASLARQVRILSGLKAQKLGQSGTGKEESCVPA